jgi:hypothetical protein
MTEQVKLITDTEEPESYDTSQPEQVNKARKKEARTRAYRLEFVKAAMSHPEGRAWFYDLLVRCKVIATPFRENPYETAFNCGQQNIGLQILSDIQAAAPQGYNQMVQENK